MNEKIEKEKIKESLKTQIWPNFEWITWLETFLTLWTWYWEQWTELPTSAYLKNDKKKNKQDYFDTTSILSKYKNIENTRIYKTEEIKLMVPWLSNFWDLDILERFVPSASCPRVPRWLEGVWTESGAMSSSSKAWEMSFKRSNTNFGIRESIEYACCMRLEKVLFITSDIELMEFASKFTVTPQLKQYFWISLEIALFKESGSLQPEYSSSFSLKSGSRINDWGLQRNLKS